MIKYQQIRGTLALHVTALRPSSREQFLGSIRHKCCSRAYRPESLQRALKRCSQASARHIRVSCTYPASDAHLHPWLSEPSQADPVPGLRPRPLAHHNTNVIAVKNKTVGPAFREVQPLSVLLGNEGSGVRRTPHTPRNRTLLHAQLNSTCSRCLVPNGRHTSPPTGTARTFSVTPILQTSISR